jgi:glutamyl/glutaminyl-tRNA synthetase
MHRKSLLVLCLALVGVFALVAAGCGGGGKNSAETTTEAVTTEAVTTEAVTTEAATTEAATTEATQTALQAALVDGLGIKPRFAYTPLRTALTGRRVSPPLFESMEILGKVSTLTRIAALRGSL